MEPINAAPFTGNQADDFMDSAIAGLSNTQEIVGDPFRMTSAPSANAVSVGATVRAVAKEAQKSRAPVPPLEVVPFSEVESMQDELVDTIVGEGVDEPIFPLTESLYHQFAAMSPDGKMVRLDDEASYADFREKGIQRSFGQRVDDLEQALTAHTADGHGGGAPYRPIALQLPPYAKGLVDCWQDGDMICCSMKVQGPDDEVRVATAATPVEAHVQEVLGCVHRLGMSTVDVLGVLPHLVGMLGGGSLVPKLASATPALLRRPEAKSGRIFVGRMKGGPRPSSAAMLMLLQMAQSGDPQACLEWGALAAVARTRSSGKLAKAMKRVQNVLTHAQRSVR